MRILPFFQTFFNNSVNTFIDFVLNDFFYGFKINVIIKLVSDVSAKKFVRLRFINFFAEDFNGLRVMIREKAEIAIFFVLIINKIRYDKFRKSIEIGIHVFLRLHHGCFVLSFFN